jgi:Asp-tRNA(Asn)/Glu-tRNA(Gln) amidotransferase A subunit family amidase
MVYTPFNYKTILEPKKYKIGVIKRFKYAKCSKPNERAVDMAVEILKKKGHQVFEVDFERI